MALIAVMLGLAAGACGDSGGSGDAAVGATDATQAGNASGAANAEQGIEAMLRELRADFNAGRGNDFCAHFTAAGTKWYRKSTGIAGELGCPRVVILVAQARRRDEALQPYPPVDVLQVRVAGDEALVRFTGGLAGTMTMTMAMVQRDGAWKLIGPDTSVGRNFARQ